MYVARVKFITCSSGKWVGMLNIEQQSFAERYLNDVCEERAAPARDCVDCARAEVNTLCSSASAAAGH
ncbi:jg22632 [Pararge aegeria aegeria]|uniref:Jg22632 protein n=1 Tax=Pararge aegeria aegeria TaxID=348720 RepID=A0A8S4QUZ0_9NEOP|nr:jg22632 [Pararge aegeria aegeria]